MKTKIFALVISILCICTVFAACSQGNVCEAHIDEDADTVCDVCAKTIAEGDVTLAPCEHKDDNADKVCELCGKAIVTMIVAPATEEEPEAPAVEAPIPADVKLEDYIKTEPASNKLSSVKIEGTISQTNDNDQPKFALVTKPYGDSYSAYSVIDFLTGKEIIALGNTDPETAEAGSAKEIYIQLNNYYFTVETTVISNYQTESIRFAVYTYAGKLIGEEYSWTYSPEGEPVDIPNINVDIDMRNDVYDTAYFVYLTYDEITYVINPETNGVIHSENKDTIIKMPIMDDIEGNYGIITYNGTYKIYDLTKWIDCVYAFDVPGNAISSSANMLENGNVLAQYMEFVAASSPSYDMIVSGTVKVDLVSVLIDPVAKTEEKVDFDYFVINVGTAGENDLLFTDKVDNVFYAYSLDDIDMMTGTFGDSKTLIVSNDLDILCECKLSTYSQIIGSGLYAQEYYFGENDMAIEIVDIKGDHKSYFGVYSFLGYGFVKVDNRFYDYDKNLIVDLDVLVGDGYIIYEDGYGFAIYTDLSSKYYYYAYGAKEGVAISTDKTDFTLEDVGGYGYVISYTSGGSKVYELYGTDNTKLATSAADFNSLTYFEYEDCVAWVFSTTEAGVTSYYIVK